MQTELARHITQRAYALNPSGLDQTLHQLGGADWLTAVRDLSFQEVGTGGGCRMLVANLPASDVQVVITDGEADLPQTADRFWLAVLDAEEDELISVAAGEPF